MNQRERATDARTSATLEFDYVVVGAGSAGCVMASRLAESEGVTVALLEAGPADHHYSVWAPLGIAMTVPRAGPRNYAYYTEPQPGLAGRRSYQPRGRGLGGSSSINGMVYIRGHRHDYDSWAQAGCPGWSYDEVLPYFRRSESNGRHRSGPEGRFHGTDGPLYVNELSSPNPFSHYFVQAAQQAGLPLNPDFNGAEQEGVGLYQVTQHDGERWNTARAWLHRGDASDTRLNGGRERLAVMTGAMARRIVFDAGRRACGVEIVRDGVVQTVRARREVVLSAGAFNSPQLLMVSGVGPAAHLQEMGVEVVHDLPGVGQNLQDHLDIIVNKSLGTTELFGRSLGGMMRLASEVRRYRRDRTGMVTSNLAEAGAFVKSRAELSAPDLQLHFVPAMLGNRGEGKPPRGHGYSCHACVLRPHSRGELKLRSADMRDAPGIDPRFLSDERDLAGMVEGVKIVQRIFSQRALASHGGTLFAPGGEASLATDDAIGQFVRANADTVYHPVGTCRMGADEQAVVDPALRVRGVDGLRVVDASVMPTLVGGNTNAPTIMIAEKAADLMRAERR
ncbi:MAG: GMC family oxidoreductase N-terminal domain-containing protein [Paraburkholderia sp.]|jgi:choline dehydrogenase-like flavoprotein|nr:GMC family oxidoreductase N-terminal domain-containing protein [Paraburkholderia sp.]